MIDRSFDLTKGSVIHMITTTNLNPSVVEIQLSMPPIEELGTVNTCRDRQIAFWRMVMLEKEYHIFFQEKNKEPLKRRVDHRLCAAYIC